MIALKGRSVLLCANQAIHYGVLYILDRVCSILRPKRCIEILNGIALIVASKQPIQKC